MSLDFLFREPGSRRCVIWIDIIWKNRATALHWTRNISKRTGIEKPNTRSMDAEERAHKNKEQNQS